MADIKLSSRPVPAPPPEKDWLTKSEVCELLWNISERTLERYIEQGAFPAGIPCGGTNRWRWEDIAYFHLRQQILPRLAVVEGDEDAGDDMTSRRQRAPKQAS